ncbi:hypothetical protein [Burkholderia cepacia]
MSTKGWPVQIQKFAHDHCSAGAILWRGWNNSWKWFVVGLDWQAQCLLKLAAAESSSSASKTGASISFSGSISMRPPAAITINVATRSVAFQLRPKGGSDL